VLSGDRLPEPPERLPAQFDLAEEEVSAWRLHREEDPLEARRYPAGRYRFDAPSGEYASLYCNADRLAVFAEVYGDARVIGASQRERRLSHIFSRGGTLRLVPLDDPGVQKCLGLDGQIGMSKQYPVTQRWALSLFRWFPDADGIRYLSRHAGEHRNYCLFAERCAGKLGVEHRGEISTLREAVLLAADKYHLEVHWNG
jgi:hypothetical protein